MEASDAVRCSRSRMRWRQMACPAAQDAVGDAGHRVSTPFESVLASGLCPAAIGRADAAGYARFYRAVGKPGIGSRPSTRRKRSARWPVQCNAGAPLADPGARPGASHREPAAASRRHDRDRCQAVRDDSPTDSLRAHPQRALCSAAGAPRARRDASDRRLAAGHPGTGHDAAGASAARAPAAGDSGAAAVARREPGTRARAARDAAADGADLAAAAARCAEDDEVNEVQLAHRVG